MNTEDRTPRGTAAWTLACTAVLLAVNVYITRDLFAMEYTRHMGSIESTHISIARFLMQDWWNLSWWSLWYGGTPFQTVYPPLSHMMVAIVATLLNISPALSYHAVSAAFYCLGPVALFWMAYRLTGARWYSLGAGLLYSLLSPSAFLIPAIRSDIGGLLYARRLQALMHYGEGPHVASLTLLPVAIVCLHLCLQKRKPVYYLLAALSAAAVALTNWLGAFTLAAAAIAYLLSRDSQHRLRLWGTAAAIGVYAYLLAAPLVPPSAVRTVQTNSEWMGGPYAIGSRHWLYAVLFLVGVGVLHIVFRRLRVRESLRFFSYFLFFMASITLAAEYFDIFVTPQPQRYHLQMEMALVLVLVFAARGPLKSLSRRWQAAAAVALLLVCVVQIREYRRYAKSQISSIDIRSTIEYKVASWSEANMKERRVLLPGSVGFWLNVFTDVPQLAGGSDQSMINPLLPHILYQIRSGADAGNQEGEIAAMWLKVFGVHAVGVNGPNSKEYFKPFKNPNKFDGVLRELWREGDDVIYEVPQRSASLAHVVREEDVVVRKPKNVFDMDSVVAYAAALDDPSLPLAQFLWRSRHSATVTADLRQEQLLSIQINHHPGWHASVNGEPRRLYRDNLGMIQVAARCEGRCTVELDFDGGREMTIARFLSGTSLLAGLLWVLYTLFRKRHPSLPASVY